MVDYTLALLMLDITLFVHDIIAGNHQAILAEIV